MEILHNLTLENKQILSPAQLQSLEILSMDALELDDFLRDEYMSNPLLEHIPDNGQQTNVDFLFYPQGGSEQNGQLIAPDKDFLKNHLTSQLDIRRFSAREWKLILYFIDCLEDNGYFKMSLEELSHLTGTVPEKLQEILQLLQDLEPYGIFAKDLSSCLLKQLEMAGIQNSDLEKMIRSHLPDISEGRISTISRALHLSTEQVRKYIAVISRMNPNPLSGLRETTTSYHIPDIIFEKSNHVWEIKINDNWSGNYSINNYYLLMMQETRDPELIEYFKTKLERCRFLLRSMEQRRETIRKIAEAVLKKQTDYFNGTGPLKPMTMAELAGVLDIHPSTVTRAVKGKYLQFPKGTILMKNLFSAPVSPSTAVEGHSGNYSASHIKTRIKELILHEDKTKPLSDAKLAAILEEEGIDISRRAIAKYRDELFIKSSFDRKER